MNKVNLLNDVLESYNRQTQSRILNLIQISINQGADGFLNNVRKVTSSQSALISDSVILADASGGAVTVTLKPAAECVGKIVSVKRLNSGANNVTVACNGSETIDGSATVSLTTQYQSVTLTAYEGNWWKLD